MSTDRDTTRIVRSWLRTDDHESADRVLGAVLDHIDTTPQRRRTWWPARRFPKMNNAVKLGLAAAAVAVAAVLGFNYLAASNVGGPAVGDPSQTPPAPTPDSTPPVLISGDLDAGTYRVTRVEGVIATMTVPDGWSGVQASGVGKESEGSSAAVVVIWPSDPVGVYADPCQWQDGYVDPPVGPTVDDLATALANQPQRGEAVPVEVSIDGYEGKMIEMTVPMDINFEDCWSGQFRSWPGRWHQGPGQVDRIYIIDVGGQRVVIDAHFLPGTSEPLRAEQQAIVDSIQLDER